MARFYASCQGSRGEAHRLGGEGDQFPHVRALPLCLACGGGKSRDALVCTECHNKLQMLYDRGYGATTDRVIERAERAIVNHGMWNQEAGTAH